MKASVKRRGGFDICKLKLMQRTWRLLTWVEGTGSAVQEGEDDAGKISWDLWGGDAGRSWANRIIRMVESRKSDQ